YATCTEQGVAQAEETLNRVPARLNNTNGEPAKPSPGRPPKAAVSLEQGTQADATRWRQGRHGLGEGTRPRAWRRCLGCGGHAVLKWRALVGEACAGILVTDRGSCLYLVSGAVASGGLGTSVTRFCSEA